jgi:FtsH-binding integral membrane protein
MSSPEVDTQIVESGPPTEGLSRLLDLAFGFFIWVAHFLVVYVGAAVACALAPHATGSSAALQTALALATVVAASVLVLHGLRRYRRQRNGPDEGFPAAVAIGCDAIALVAIVWQLFPIFLVPACA